MKINEEQLLKLIMIAKDTMGKEMVIGGLSSKDRVSLVSEIVNQQSKKRYEVGEVEGVEEI
jgi:hypothetical protein